MNDYKKSVKFALGLTYFFAIALIALSVSVPFIVEWYVEYRGKDPNLATTLMITYYPCVPLAAVSLYSVIKLLKNILSGLVLGDENIKLIKRISVCLFVAATFMMVMGYRYAPFYVSGVSALACGLFSYVLGVVFDAELQAKRDQEFESVREQYEKDNNLGNR